MAEPPLLPAETESGEAAERDLADLIFVGFNSRAFALDRYTGELVWQWKSPEGSGFVSLLLDGDRLIAAVNGYIYCLDPLYGQEVWRNPLKGFGMGVASLTSLSGSTPAGAAAKVTAQQKAASGAAAGAAASAGGAFI